MIPWVVFGFEPEIIVVLALHLGVYARHVVIAVSWSEKCLSFQLVKMCLHE